jgi:hypothetical protein
LKAYLSYLAVQKNRCIHCKTMFTCWVSRFCNGFTLGPTAQATLVYIYIYMKLSSVERGLNFHMVERCKNTYLLRVVHVRKWCCQRPCGSLKIWSVLQGMEQGLFCVPYLVVTTPLHRAILLLLLQKVHNLCEQSEWVNASGPRVCIYVYVKVAFCPQLIGYKYTMPYDFVY